MRSVEENADTSPFVLATDLDGTFAGGTAAERRALQRALADRQATLVYVTGRSVPSARSLMAELDLPRPRTLIADVGASVVDGHDLAPLDGVDAAIAERWPGAEAVRRRLDGLEGVSEQHVGARRRVSYVTRNGELADALERARRRLDGLDVELIASAGVYIDVMPGGVHKGSTLLRTRERLDGAPERWIVAGDTMNDFGLLTTGLAGIVVGNAEPELRRRLDGRDDIFVAEGHGAAGILEGLTHFGLIEANGDGE